MKMTLHIYGDHGPSVSFVAETDAEKAILAFITECPERRWKSDPSHNQRVGGVAHADLFVDPTSEPKQ